MADLVVDLDGLTALGASLGRIRTELAAARDDLRGHGDVLGHGRVTDELDRFEDRWRDGRAKIEANCEVLGTMVTQSVETYRQVDDELTTALTVTPAP